MSNNEHHNSAANENAKTAFKAIIEAFGVCNDCAAQLFSELADEYRAEPTPSNYMDWLTGGDEDDNE